MDELENDRDDDLSVLGSEDADSTDMLEEDGERLHSGKIKAAFVKLRQERKQLRDELEKVKTAFGQLGAQVSQVQRQRQAADTPELSRQRRAYHENVRQRAIANLAGEVFNTEQERDAAIWQEMTAITSNDAAQLAIQKVAQMQSPQVLAGVLGEFRQLDEADKTSIRDMVDKLPIDLKLDPEAIRNQVHSYIGRNFEKFSQPREEQKEEPTRRSGTTPATGQKTADGRVRLSEGAGAAAASGLKGGSPGVRLTEGTAGKPKGSPKQLTEEDIQMMKSQGIDPSNPEDTNLFLESKELAKRKALGI